MKNLDDIQPTRPDQGFQFPGVFEVNAIGTAGGGMEDRVTDIIAGLGLSVLEGSRRVRPSREGHYVSIAVSFTCPSREAYEQVHAALRADPDIRWTL